MSANVLFVTYDGLSDFVSRSQVLPYMEKLSGVGHKIIILSFEKRVKDEAALISSQIGVLRKMNIMWVRRGYHKTPAVPATLFDVIQGVVTGMSIVRKYHVDLVHARGYIPMLIACAIKRMASLPAIFDMRGFWPDEKTDAGYWKEDSLIYRSVKALERYLLRCADEIVVLTEAAKERIIKLNAPNAPITVIPCCVDIGIFCRSHLVATTTNISGGPILLYIGNLGSFYNLDSMIDFFKYIKKEYKEAFFRIVSNYPEKMMRETAGKHDLSDYSIGPLDHKDIPEALSAADFSIIFYKRKLSGEGCSPIKLAESLACGVPVIINAGIGDSADIVKRYDAGVVLNDFKEEEYRRAIQEMKRLMRDKAAVRSRCAEAAKAFFSLDMATKRYDTVYERAKNRAVK